MICSLYAAKSGSSSATFDLQSSWQAPARGPGEGGLPGHFSGGDRMRWAGLMQGQGLELVRLFYSLLPQRQKWHERVPEAVSFLVDEVFSVPGVGTVVAGTLKVSLRRNRLHGGQVHRAEAGLAVECRSGAWFVGPSIDGICWTASRVPSTDGLPEWRGSISSASAVVCLRHGQQRRMLGLGAV